jgi:hypothetical protein
MSPADLVKQVIDKTGRRIRNLSVDVESENVVLHGQASSYYLKQLAQHCIQDVMPQVRLKNDIEVVDEQTYFTA